MERFDGKIAGLLLGKLRIFLVPILVVLSDGRKWWEIWILLLKHDECRDAIGVEE